MKKLYAFIILLTSVFLLNYRYSSGVATTRGANIPVATGFSGSEHEFTGGYSMKGLIGPFCLGSHCFQGL
jgi:hypothetical protein